MYAREGLRVLAVAYRTIAHNDKKLPSSIREYTPELIEQDLTFLGLIAMQDPPRSEVKEAVELCHSAGIKIDYDYRRLWFNSRKYCSQNWDY